jgi:hypothetical protein
VRDATRKSLPSLNTRMSKGFIERRWDLKSKPYLRQHGTHRLRSR